MILGATWFKKRRSVGIEPHITSKFDSTRLFCEEGVNIGSGELN